MPSTPSTLAISCGSQIAVVTPCGSTQRSNSCGVTSEDFDMQMRVDEARHRDQAAPVDLARAPIAVVSADDAVAADGDVGLRHRAGDDVEQPDVLDDEISRRSPQP